MPLNTTTKQVDIIKQYVLWSVSRSFIAIVNKTNPRFQGVREYHVALVQKFPLLNHRTNKPRRAKHTFLLKILSINAFPQICKMTCRRTSTLITIQLY